jgi:competence protein ComEC
MKFNYKTNFIEEYPALYYAAAALLGASAALSYLPLSFTFIYLILLTLPVGVKRAALLLGLCIAAYLKTTSTYHFPDQSIEAISGTAAVRVESESIAKSHFGSKVNYRGQLLAFWDQDQSRIARQIPINFLLPEPPHGKALKNNETYTVKCTLKRQENGTYCLTGFDRSNWTRQKSGNWGLNVQKWRSNAKKKIKEYLYAHVKNPHAASFLTGIATGEFDNLQLSFELARFGLQHLMAISGLHFSIIASFLTLLLSLIFSNRVTALVLIVLLTLYFIFLGGSPSVLRTWIAITVTLAGALIERKTNGQNVLGLALLYIALFDPTLLQTIAFQYSFGITASILIAYPWIENKLERVLKKRKLHEVLETSIVNRVGIALSQALRQLFALAIAVNLTAIPLTLYYFHSFPLMSLIYNLFFPFLISLSLCLLILSLIFYPLQMLLGAYIQLPSLPEALLQLNEKYTEFVLNIAFCLPHKFDYKIIVESLPSPLLLSYFAILFIMVFYLAQRDANILKIDRG